MKLKEFNPENTVSTGRTTTPAISINLKAGLFTFNKGASQQLGLKDQSQILIHQDETEQENWYLEVVTKKGFLL